MLLADDSDLYVDLCRILGQSETVSASYATDAGWLQQCGLECLLWGPGTIEVAHRPNESMPKDEYRRASEILGHSYHHLFGFNFTALRFFTVYGPNGRPDMMAYLVAESATKGTLIPLYEGGMMYRDWTFVDDITNGVMAAIDRPLGYEIINIGRGEPTLLKDFVAMIETLAGQKANVVHKPKLSADFVRNQADISKARRLLDYDPKVSVPEGVKAFWDWYVVHG